MIGLQHAILFYVLAELDSLPIAFVGDADDQGCADCQCTDTMTQQPGMH